jgi:hypothetical protein
MGGAIQPPNTPQHPFKTIKEATDAHKTPEEILQYINSQNKNYPAPSTHVNWTAHPSNTAVTQFTNSIKILTSHKGTFFMTNGCSAGYLGLQDRDPKWIIFSIWDQPNAPVETIELGPLTKSEPFGGEGTGGKSWIEFDWQIGETYSCRLSTTPDTLNTTWTVFTGEFQHPELGWILIAKFKTKMANNSKHHLSSLSSFLEDWMGQGNGCTHPKGEIRRECILGPPMVQIANNETKTNPDAESNILVTSCKGCSADTRQMAGYQNRHVYLLETGLVGVAIGGNGQHEHGTDLYYGELDKTISDENKMVRIQAKTIEKEMKTVKTNGTTIHLESDVGGPVVGMYSEREGVLNNRNIYCCDANNTLIGWGGNEWHMANTVYLKEIMDKQGGFGSFDHSTNGDVEIECATWDKYTVVIITDSTR